MKFFAVSLPVRWIALVAFLAAASWAGGQQTIQFTKPADQDLGKANSFLPSPTSRLSAGAFNAPSPLFGDRTPTVSFDILPGGPTPSVTPNSSKWQKALDARKNWALSTPEEILNIQTPEKIFGIADPKDDRRLSAEERFLQRRQRQDLAAGSNGLSRAEGYLRNNNQVQFSDADSPFGQTFQRSSADLTQKPSGLFGGWNSDPQTETDQKVAPGWSSAFGQPLPKPTPEALAGMDRFRAMMEGSAPEKTPAANPYSYQPTAVATPRMQAVPAGTTTKHSSFSALEDNTSRPIGLAPLSGLNSPRATAQKSTSLVQPPPWMNDTPQSFNLPQRQF
jgi:hypothetical protein